MHFKDNIMVYRKMLHLHWTTSRLYQSMYTAGDADIYYMIQMIRNVSHLSLVFAIHLRIINVFVVVEEIEGGHLRIATMQILE